MVVDDEDLVGQVEHQVALVLRPLQLELDGSNWKARS
jgi:hypothetical protein